MSNGFTYVHIVTDLINALPGNNSVNTVQYAAIEEAVFSVDPPDAPTDCLDSNHVICVYLDPCPFRGYIRVTGFVRGSYELRVSSSGRSRQTRG
jgi:hypothetical protein